MKRIIRLLFYAFVAALPFETAPMGIPAKPTQVLAVLLVLATLLQPRACYGRVPAALWCFAAYVYVGAVGLLLAGSEHFAEAAYQLFVVAELALIFWIAYNLMQHQEIAEGFLKALAAGCGLLALLLAVGVAQRPIDTDTTAVRVSAFHSDPNNLAQLLAMSLLAIVGLMYLVERPRRLRPLIGAAALALIGWQLVATGSRGGILCMVVGLLAFGLRKGRLIPKIRTAMLTLAALAVLALVGYSSRTVRERFEATIESGKMAKREYVYPLALAMFRERPLLGWGVVTNTYEMGARLRAYHQMTPIETNKDIHDMPLYLLTATGLLGAVPFLYGVWLCVRAAWRARGGPHSILPFALVVAALAADLSVDGHHWKQHWLMMAYGLASLHFSAATHARKRARLTAVSPEPWHSIPLERVPRGIRR